ncbi:unnamed protein product, partial [Staurois parvus]
KQCQASAHCGQCITGRGGLTIWKLGQCPRAQGKGPHEMPLVLFS